MRHNSGAIWVIIACVVVDQVSKHIANAQLKLAEAHTIISGVLDIQLVYNFGSAYGLFAHQRTFLLVVGTAIVGLFVIGHRWVMTSTFSRWGYGFFIGGAIGNLIDRFFLGYVIDFINIHIFPVFNVADVCIDIGIGLFLLDLIYDSINRSKTQSKT